jgi:hypothetical protein
MFGPVNVDVKMEATTGAAVQGHPETPVIPLLLHRQTSPWVKKRSLHHDKQNIRLVKHRWRDIMADYSPKCEHAASISKISMTAAT